MFNTMIRKWNSLPTWSLAALCALMLGFLFAPTAKADAWDKSTVVTFSGPVEIPGRVLPAGTYTIMLLNDPSDRNVVQIFDRDGRHLLATLFAVTEYRRTPADGTVIRFSERAANAPEAIRDWFYPGDDSGLEFVYPHKHKG